jgi:hypothetical protein
MAHPGAIGEAAVMQVLQPQPTRTGSPLSILTGLTIGLLLVGLGAALAYLAVATPFSQQFTPDPRSSPARVVLSALGWTLLIVAPAVAALAGIAWLAGVAEATGKRRRRAHPVAGLSRVLGEDYLAATSVRLPDGRLVSEVIVGPHGIAVFEPLPPPSLTRVQSGRWELRVGRDRWVPMENPLERAARSADRVRHWLGGEDHGFVVRVYAAVIAPEGALTRSANCAVVSREQVPAYLNSLPIQRGFTPERRARIVDDIRAAV